MAWGLFKGLFGSSASKAKKPGMRSTVHYKSAKSMAASEDIKARRTLASQPDTEPEILYFLAEDPDPGVRRAIAENTATPRHADLLLARDDDGAVRTTLAEKIARLAPGITPGEQDKIRAMTHQILEILAHDQVVRVREILSDILKDEADASPELIRRLAWDAELVVSGPVLERSPVLTDADLIAIIESEPIAGALKSISRRKNLMAAVSDAIVQADDEDAITSLLANGSAQIREETLDHLIERAGDVTAWQAPLVGRPVLSEGAAARLAEFVADNLLQTLAMRRDLPPDVIAKVRVEVHRRLGAGDEKDKTGAGIEIRADEGRPATVTSGMDRPDVDKPGMDGDDSPLDEALKEAEELYKKGALGGDVIMAALAAERRNFVIAALSVRAELPVGIAGKIMENESLKGLVALAWKAGLPAKNAVQLQRFLLKTLPGDVLGADGGIGYPLSEEDMNWQLDFFRDMAGV